MRGQFGPSDFSTGNRVLSATELASSDVVFGRARISYTKIFANSPETPAALVSVLSCGSIPQELPDSSLGAEVQLSCVSCNGGVKQTAMSKPSGLSNLAVICDHGSVRAS